MAGDRCPRCKALYSLVGRVHNCVVVLPLIQAPAHHNVPILRKPGGVRIEDRDKTIEAQKPWEKLGMSRRTWYRRQAEKRKES